jgi:hypothetical protein
LNVDAWRSSGIDRALALRGFVCFRLVVTRAKRSSKQQEQAATNCNTH